MPLQGLGTHIYSLRGCATLHYILHYTLQHTHRCCPLDAKVQSKDCTAAVLPVAATLQQSKRLLCCLLLPHYNSQKTASVLPAYSRDVVLHML
jgi:hypothetical protein